MLAITPRTKQDTKDEWKVKSGKDTSPAQVIMFDLLCEVNYSGPQVASKIQPRTA